MVKTVTDVKQLICLTPNNIFAVWLNAGVCYMCVFTGRSGGNRICGEVHSPAAGGVYHAR